MAPLKWGVEELGEWKVRHLGEYYGGREGTPHETILNKLRMCVAHCILCGMGIWVGPFRVGGGAVLLSCSDGVS